MPRFAIIKNLSVENVIIAENLESAMLFGNAVELNESTSFVGPGTKYDIENNTFIKVYIEPILTDEEGNIINA